MKTFKLWGVGATISLVCLLASSLVSEAGTLTAGKMHIGTFEGSTTFTTSSSNGINPGLFIEVRDADGNLKQYESEDGVITVENTKEGAYVTQAKLLGKTKYVDQDTGEVLDEWEEGRNLTLESVQTPVLTTTGKNLFDGELLDGYFSNDISTIGGDKTVYKSIKIKLTKGTYTLSFDKPIYIVREIKDGTYAQKTETHSAYTFTVNTDGYYGISFGDAIGMVEWTHTQAMIEKGATATSYEPYQSNVLTVSEDMFLRGVGNVQDELDLLTGKVAQNVMEIVLDGSENWSMYTLKDEYPDVVGFYTPLSQWGERYGSLYNYLGSLPPVESDALPGNLISNTELITVAHSQYVKISIYKDKLNSVSTNGFKQWLFQNPLYLQYRLKNPIIKTVDLNSTYQFNLVSDSVVKISGEVIPTIYSITVPSEPLTFVLNPNAEEGQQFIAPEFQITNQSPGPIQLELKTFEQITDLFNDVLPDQHDDWSQLNKEESKDIALALVPKPSDAWLTLHEGPKYVADSTNLFLGEIRKNATVEFSFSALHGGVFDLSLFPMVFTFGF